MPDTTLGEDPDFEERFRRDRARRWWNGARNGISVLSLARYRLGLGGHVRFKGVAVQQSDNQATYRLIEDIWMRGEYDVPGYVPQPGWQVVDIGANVGIYSMLAASRGARVIAYEPGPSAFRRLTSNTQRWGVECHMAAVVSEPRDTATLFIHPRRDTRNTLLPPDRAEAFIYADSVEVPAITLAEVLATPCDLLKLDCEGAEFELLMGNNEALRNASRIIAEVDTGAGDADALVCGLRDAGFDVDLAEPSPGTEFCQLLAAKATIE